MGYAHYDGIQLEKDDAEATQSAYCSGRGSPIEAAEYAAYGEIVDLAKGVHADLLCPGRAK